MRKLYVVLLVTFFALSAKAQIVSIPDAQFKQQLLNCQPPVDTNEDGEIQESEAQAVTSLGLHQCNLNNVIGIQAFTNLETLIFGSYFTLASPVDLSGMSNLKHLDFNKASMPSVNVSGLTGLETLSLGYSSITFLNLDALVNLKTLSYYISAINGPLNLSYFPNLENFTGTNVHGIEEINLEGLANLETFICRGSSNIITNVDLSDLVNLRVFNLSGSQLTTINFDNNLLLEEISCTGNDFAMFDVSNQPHLTKLICTENHLTSLDLSNNADLKTLYCSDNALTAIDLSNLHKVTTFEASNNLFTSLDLSSFTESIAEDEATPMYNVRDNPNLVNVSLKNGREDYVDAQILNCPNLNYLCLDDIEIDGQNDMLQANGITNVEINSFCDQLGNSEFDNPSVAMYPNPTKDKFTITSKGKITSIQIFDLQGRLVQTTTANDKNAVLDLSNNSVGIYFVKIYSGIGTKVEKIIKN